MVFGYDRQREKVFLESTHFDPSETSPAPPFINRSVSLGVPLPKGGRSLQHDPGPTQSTECLKLFAHLTITIMCHRRHLCLSYHPTFRWIVTFPSNILGLKPWYLCRLRLHIPNNAFCFLMKSKLQHNNTKSANRLTFCHGAFWLSRCRGWK